MPAHLRNLLRRALERVSRRLVFCRRLPARFGGTALAVTPGAALAYWRPLGSGAWNDLFDFAEHAVEPGAVVWDVGANLAVFAFAAAYRAGPAGEVLAVEPDGWLVDLIRRSAGAPRPGAAPVEALCCAAAAEVGLQSFDVTGRTRSGSHLASAGGAGVSLVGPAVERHPVVTVSLDWLAERRRPPAVVKIDVEGAEQAVLAGAENVLARHRPKILVEVYERNADAVTARLTRHGYALHDFAGGWGHRRPVNRAAYNTLALPRS
jgi:FkbM family methyltransferase